MKDIQKRELTRAIDLIKALGCTYKVITPDGEAFGELEVVTKKPKAERAPRKDPYGAVVAYSREKLDMNAAVGVVQEVPCGAFDAESLRSSLCNVLTKAWGKDTYTTAAHHNKVEVMRIAMEAS